MENSFLAQLLACTTSAEEVSFTDELRVRLETLGERAAENAQRINAFTFTYQSLGNTIAGFAVVPKTNTGKLPVIIFNRGGNKDFGLVKQGMLFLQIAEMANWGYIVTGSQYPGNSVSEGHDQFGGETDVQSILDLYPILEQLSLADTTRIGMFGGSRGGMMTYLCLTKVDWIKCAVSIAGASNLVRQTVLRPEMQEIFNDTFGGDEEAKKQRSAVYWPEKLPDSAPILLMHGTADWRVSPLDSIDLAAKLYEYKKPFSLMVYNGGDHGLTQYEKEWQSLASGWLGDNLG